MVKGMYTRSMMLGLMGIIPALCILMMGFPGLALEAVVFEEDHSRQATNDTRQSICGVSSTDVFCSQTFLQDLGRYLIVSVYAFFCLCLMWDTIRKRIAEFTEDQSTMDESPAIRW